MAKERDTYKYHLKEGKTVVHRGITYDLDRREAQHQVEHPGSRIDQVGRKTTRDSALKWVRGGGKRPYKSQRLCKDLAAHLHGTWLTVEDAQVRELVEAARAVLDLCPVGNRGGLQVDLARALAPFEKKGEE